MSQGKYPFTCELSALMSSMWYKNSWKGASTKILVLSRNEPHEKHTLQIPNNISKHPLIASLSNLTICLEG